MGHCPLLSSVLLCAVVAVQLLLVVGENTTLPLCSQLSFTCSYSCSCSLGDETALTCEAPEPCTGVNSSSTKFICQMCFQTPHYQHNCTLASSCNMRTGETYIAKCTVHADVLCFGNRTFLKRLPCSNTTKKRWLVAMWLSCLLGGFGADRFFLGHSGWGIFKLMTLGGFGIWTLIDLILIGTGYLHPTLGMYSATDSWFQ